MMRADLELIYDWVPEGAHVLAMANCLRHLRATRA